MKDPASKPSQTTQYRPLRILKQVLATPRRYTRPWYFAYLLLGIVTAGMVPVLLPLMLTAKTHELSSVAYVMGMYNLGLLTSPLWGILVERRKLYRTLFIFAFLLSTISIAVFPFMRTMPLWMLAAFMLGVGSTGAATISSLLIVNFEPPSEWEPRIGMLQSFYGTGQVIGLMLAGIFSHGTISTGLWVAAIVLTPTFFIAKMGLPAASHMKMKRASNKRPHSILDMRALATFPHINFSSGISFHFNDLNISGLRRLPAVVGSRFGRILLSWFMLGLGVAGFFTYFPLMLAHSYDINSHLSSLLYAIMAAIGISLFVLASHWSVKWGASRVFRFGLWLRIIAFTLLLLPFIVPLGHRFAFGAVGFCLIVIAWPIISVSATNLAARLAPFSEGAAMGLFSATWAMGTMMGAFASGPMIAAFGYQSIPVAALVCIGVAIVLSWRLSSHATTLQIDPK